MTDAQQTAETGIDLGSSSKGLSPLPVFESGGDVAIEIVDHPSDHASGPVAALWHPDERHASLMIGEILVDLGYASEQEVEAAVAKAAETGDLTGQVLLANGVVTDRQLTQAVAARYRMPFFDYDEYPLDDNVIQLVTPQLALALMAVPVAFAGDDAVVVAVADASKAAMAESIGALVGKRPIVALASEHDIFYIVRDAAVLLTSHHALESESAADVAPAATTEPEDPPRLTAVA